MDLLLKHASADFASDGLMLQLLLCGADSYSVADLKRHHVVSGSSYGFSRVMQRFWTIVSAFTNDDMAR